MASLLPEIAGFIICCALLTRKQRRGGFLSNDDSRQRYLSFLILVIFALLVIYEIVIATLALTYLGPEESVLCGLDTTWYRLFRGKDENAIKAIQDTYNCCGLHSTVDKAFPFPGGNNDVHACEKAFGRTKPCFGAWKRGEKTTASLISLVAIFAIAIALVNMVRSSRYLFVQMNFRIVRHPLTFLTVSH